MLHDVFLILLRYQVNLLLRYKMLSLTQVAF